MNKPTLWDAHKSTVGDWVITQDGEHICRELRHWNKDLILVAVNACKAINPEHPELVAKQIKATFELLKAMHPEFESGAIANEAKWADKLRLKFEGKMKAVLSAISNEQETL